MAEGHMDTGEMCDCEDMEQDEKDEENRIKFYLEAFEPYVRGCLSSSDLKDLILHYKGFDLDERKRLSHEDKKTDAELFSEIVTAIRNINDPLKYTALAKAFKEMKHEKVYLLLTGATLPDNDTHEKVLYKCGVAICQRLDVDNLLPSLIAEELISDQNRQKIEMTLKSDGKWNAAYELWKCISNRRVNWYIPFMEILLKNQQKDLANIIDKELRQVRNAGADTCVTMVVNQENNQFPTPSTSTEQCMYEMEDTFVHGSVKEHVISDCVNAEPMNDLDAPPPIPKRFDSLPEDIGEIKESNLQEFNIKPEPSKSVNVEDNIEEDSQNEVPSAKVINMTKQAGKSTVNLREYQLELAENALAGRNTVIVAGTGSGKTWVALHIVNEHLANDAQGTRKVIFMARTSTLIKQQADRFETHLPDFQTKLITGENEESNSLGMFKPYYDILCFTPQILINNLENGSIKSLSEFSLMILDECHHTKGDEPYNMLMRKYLIEKTMNTGQVLELPQIVGLTASIGVGKSHNDKDACDYILRLFARLDVRVLSTVPEKNLKEYEKFTSDSKEELIKMVTPKHDQCKDVILEEMEATEEKLKDFTCVVLSLLDLLNGNCPSNKQSQEYNKWTVEVEQTAIQNIKDEEMLRTVRSFVIYLKVYNAALEVNSLLGPPDVVKFLASKHQRESANQAKLTSDEKELFESLKGVLKKLRSNYERENPNVRTLSDTLKEMIRKDPKESRAMVFVQARATCTALQRFLKKDFKDMDIDVHHLYGKEHRGGEDGMTEKDQNETVEKFRNGDYKILVATSVGVEGIDVPDCNIVLNYNCIGNEITKLQMKGRGRKKMGFNVIIGGEKQIEHERINAYKLLMMERAKKLFLDMDPKFIEKKIALYQKEEMKRYEMKKELEKFKRNRKGTDVDFVIKCRNCGEFACCTSDVKKIKNQYIVIDGEFEDRIMLAASKRPRAYDGFYQKSDMKCIKCASLWGIVSENKGYTCRTLKLDCFKLINSQTGTVGLYKKWTDVPTVIPEIQVDDLSN